MTPLCELARKYGTDKGGGHLQRGDTCHNYTPAYWNLFHRRRHQVEAVLEIGIGGGHSLRMWKEFFNRALIYGIDCDPKCLAQAEDRIQCFTAHQNDGPELTRIMQTLDCKFDLIIDDGSHQPTHQIFTAQVLLPYLTRYGGVYVIEDIEPDCKPELIGDLIVDGLESYVWTPISTGRGLGRAYCRCGCEGGEQLVTLRHV